MQKLDNFLFENKYGLKYDCDNNLDWMGIVQLSVGCVAGR